MQKTLKNLHDVHQSLLEAMEREDVDQVQALLDQRGQHLEALGQALAAMPAAQRSSYQAALAELARQDGILQERSRLTRDALDDRLRGNGSRSGRSAQPVVTGVLDRQA